MTADIKHNLEVAAVAAAGNTAAWTLQDGSYMAAIFVSSVTGVWVIIQTVRFIQKWLREDEIYLDKLEKRKAADYKTAPGALGD